jgi:hypothetical protein
MEWRLVSYRLLHCAVVVVALLLATSVECNSVDERQWWWQDSSRLSECKQHVVEGSDDDEDDVSLLQSLTATASAGTLEIPEPSPQISRSVPSKVPPESVLPEKRDADTAVLFQSEVGVRSAIAGKQGEVQQEHLGSE